MRQEIQSPLVDQNIILSLLFLKQFQQDNPLTFLEQCTSYICGKGKASHIFTSQFTALGNNFNPTVEILYLTYPIKNS
jgi:hypothetical protein